jgi:hypothetical protein
VNYHEDFIALVLEAMPDDRGMQAASCRRSGQHRALEEKLLQGKKSIHSYLATSPAKFSNSGKKSSLLPENIKDNPGKWSKLTVGVSISNGSLAILTNNIMIFIGLRKDFICGNGYIFTRRNFGSKMSDGSGINRHQ